MRSMIVLIFTLTIVCLLSALALALVNIVTEDRIAEQKRLAKLRAVLEALPRDYVQYDNDPSRDVITISEWKEKDGTPKVIYVGKKHGEVIGVAFTSSGEGYGGIINIMIGLDITGKMTGIQIIEHLETPGLGSMIESKELFRNQFRGKSSENSPSGELKVVKGRKANKDWEIQALTGASISPTGVVRAINSGLTMFKKYQERILAGNTQEMEQK